MQKRHLHWILLILLAGCGTSKFSEENPYIHKNKLFRVEYGNSSEARIFLFNGSRFEITSARGGRREMRVTTANASEAPFQFTWKNSDLQELLNGRIFRLPAGLEIVSKDSSRVLEVYPQTENSFVFILRGFSEKECGIQVTSALKTEFYLTEPKKIGKDKISFALSFESQSTADKFSTLKRDAVESEALKTLADTLAFSLNTGDERTNQAFALLASALAGASRFLDYDSRMDIENNAQLAPALFLANRQVPDLVTDNGAVGKSRFSITQKYSWAFPAWRAAVFYGMVNTSAVGYALQTSQAIQERESKKDFSFEDETIPDSLLRTAVAHAQFSGFTSFTEEMMRSRGQNSDADLYRGFVMRHSKLAKLDFNSCLKKFNARTDSKTRSKLEAVLGDSPKNKTETDDLTTGGDALMIVPDTLRFVDAGAKVGFNLIADDPEKWLREVPLNNFLWQKWTAYRFAKDTKLTQTPDYDSLLTLLLDRNNPGLLMTPRQEGSESQEDLLGMATAFQNFAEVYVGYKPDFVKQRIDIVPHLPITWGHTAAKLPFGDGLIHLDFDFVKEIAFVGIENLSGEITFVFSYPIPTGGFIPTQFKLSSERPKVKIKLRRIHENQMEIQVEDVND